MSAPHDPPAAPETVHRGHFDASIEPVPTVASGDDVGVEIDLVAWGEAGWPA